MVLRSGGFAEQERTISRAKGKRFMNGTFVIRWLRWLAAGMLVVLMPGPLWAAESVWEVLPYRVRVVAAVESGPAWPSDIGFQLTQSLVARCEALIGALWEIQASEVPPALARKMIADWDRLTPADLPASWQDGEKVLFLAVRAQGQAYRVQAREWDIRTQLFGTTVSAELYQPSKLADVALNMLVASFCPLARIDRPKEGRAVLRPRGLALPQGPSTPEWIRPGTVFRPVLRKNDRAGNPLYLKPVPWTYLVVEHLGQDGLECRIYAGWAGALAERRRGRIEMLGLAVIPPQSPTVLTLADRTAPEQPLVGYEALAFPPGERQGRSLGRTNLRGEILVPPAPYGLQVVVVASGGTPVARLPIVPGVESRLQALLPRDTPRLVAEGFVRGFQETLLDMVAQREILLTRLHRRLEQGQAQEAADLLEQLEALQRQHNVLAQQLTEQEKTLTTTDPTLRPKIEALWTQARQLLAEHMDQRLLRELASQVLRAKAAPGPPDREKVLKP